MILQTIIAILIILGVLTGWILIQHLARWFAARYPEFGPAREDGEGCGALLCLCKNKDTCPEYLFKKNLLKESLSQPQNTRTSKPIYTDQQ